ncbi:MAG: LysM peptidoglycan-binding domain-containing protein [Bacillaceae bacterium]|nr:LysM peptidoglycan-binding domain-containing protein [Bacillaceae bacterium]
MEWYKKLLLGLMIVLFAKSLLYDLTAGVLQNRIEPIQPDSKQEQFDPRPQHEKISYKTVSYQVQSGDTVLSILEQLNPELNTISVDQLMADFKKLNPGVNPHQILQGKTYLFPVYPPDQ